MPPRTTGRRRDGSSPAIPETFEPARTRRTRSQSAEVENNLPTKITRKRTREDSVESNASNVSAGSTVNRRKKARNVAQSELSMVEEDIEKEQPLETEHTTDGDNRRLSQYSGTTARDSFDEQQLEGMVPSMIVDTLPNLYDSATKVLDLVPQGTSPEAVEALLEELRIPGSSTAKRMRRLEERLKGNLSHYGEQIDFIKPHLVIKKLFRAPPDLVTPECRPDAILYAANLATAATELLVMQRYTQSAAKGIQGFDLNFPEAFVTDFGGSGGAGSSKLLDESFKAALELRTQSSLETLLEQRNLSDEMQSVFEPDKILAQIFYQDVPETSLSAVQWDQFFRKGKPLDILEPSSRNSNDQKTRIKQRVKKVRSFFSRSPDAQQDGDMVDLENLANNFPWPEFIAEMLNWCQSRLSELSASVVKYGGASDIANHVEAFIDSNDASQPVAEPSLITLQPSPEIIRSVPTKSLYTKGKARSLLKLLNKGTTSSASTSHNNESAQPTSAQSASGHSGRSTSANRQSVSVNVPTAKSNNEAASRFITSHALNMWEEVNKDRNKENLPARATADIEPTVFAAQTNLGSNAPASHRSEARSNSGQDREPELSDDDDFQIDRRVFEVKRPALPPPTQRRSLAGPSTESVHVSSREENPRRKNHPGGQSRQNHHVSDDEEASDNDERPPPTFTEVKIAANITTARHRAVQNSRTQTRTPWSLRDEEHLLELIAKYNTSWAEILRSSNFHRYLGEGETKAQVALKDKARNMRMVYEKLMIQNGSPLPLNLGNVALSKLQYQQLEDLGAQL